MAKFDLLPAQPSNADLGERIMQLHECQEDAAAKSLAGISAANAGLKKANLERRALRKGQLDTVRLVEKISNTQDITSAVVEANMKVVRESSAKIDYLGASLGSISKTVGGYEQTIKDAKKLAAWLIATLVMATITSGAAIAVNAIERQSVSVSTADRYTATDARSDRAEQDKINQALVAKMNATK